MTFQVKQPFLIGRLLVVLLGLVGAATVARAAAVDSVAALEEAALKQAAAAVAPAVVQIETSGGTDVMGSPDPSGSQVRKGTGPTTGLIIESDGYVISSAFNFANKPSAVFVAVPGRRDRHVAHVVAADHTRMLTLLKIDASGLPVPESAPKGEMKVGQSVVALGRTWAGADEPPSLSIGIISALGRIWGKAVQTDAKVSPVNYGGPLVDIRGRVVGVLVPASPRAQDETAGLEWYDSGIGFAVPLEDIKTVLPRLKQGRDLNRGLLGFVAKNPDIYSAQPEIGTVITGSAADHAGLKVGDVFTEMNGVRVTRQAQVMHVLGSLYEGDAVSLRVRRGQREIAFDHVKLSGALAASAQAFLGVLPVRDDAEAGVEVRYVFPNSPAAGAGLKPGDRLVGLSGVSSRFTPIGNRDRFMSMMATAPSGLPVRLQVSRVGVKDPIVVNAALTDMPSTIPDNLPEAATKKQAVKAAKILAAHALMVPGAQPGPQPQKPAEPPDPSKKVETGFLKRASAARDHEYYLYAPAEYDPNIAHALVIWLHGPGQGSPRAVEAIMDSWRQACRQQHLIVLAPVTQNENGWLASEAELIRQDARDVMSQYMIDSQRIVAWGAGSGAQMAYYLGFHARDLIRGVATIGPFAAADPDESIHAQRLAFFLIASERDPLLGAIKEIQSKLTEKRFVVTERRVEGQELDEATQAELVRWIDSLDRQ
jgi:S1-C subfamily serine protease/predicted esterase